MPVGIFTVQNIIDEGLQILGVLAPGESLSSAQYADCLRTLEWIEDEWNSQEWLVPNLVSATWPLVAGKNAYAIGFNAVSPDFQGLRPQRLLQASIYQGSGSNAVRVPIRIESVLESTTHPLVNPSGYPSPEAVTLYNQPDGLGSKQLWFWPAPSTVATVELVYAPEMFSTANDLTTTVQLPSPYLRAFTYHFAISIAPKFGVKPSLDLITQAATSMRNIRNINAQPILRSGSSATYWSYITGGYEKAH
jgi:hypothetical protein